jgi:hypothetical protein
VNGYLVPPGRSAPFADAVVALLSDPAKLARFSAAARAAAHRHELTAATRQWDAILSGGDQR